MEDLELQLLSSGELRAAAHLDIGSTIADSVTESETEITYMDTQNNQLMNMDLHGVQAFQGELMCSICMSYFIDPVTIDCGHSFCRPCLSLCWEEAQTPMCCPQCREISEKPDFSTNIVLKKLASLARQAGPVPYSSSGEELCVEHREAKGLFCEAGKTLLCALCSEGPEHAAHSHSSVPWAAEEYREKLIKKMNALQKMTQEMQEHLNEEISKTQSFVDYVVLRKDMIQAQYRMMHQFLFEEEQSHLATLDREAEKTFQQLRDSEVRMSQQRERMKEMYRELTEMCHKSNSELLQDLGDVLERNELVLKQKPQPVNPVLPPLSITAILHMLDKFRVRNGMIQGWANRYMSLSEDLRIMLFGDAGAAEKPQRVESYAAWGVQAFTSGRHYWEVDVTHASNWVLGVCKDSETRGSAGCEKAFLLRFLKQKNHHSLSTNSPLLIHYVQRPLGRVGVFLDYDNATVSFYDVHRCSLMYSFFCSSFTSPLKPFACIGAP